VIEDFDFSRVDDLLDLRSKGIRMVVFQRLGGEEVSSSHLALFREWVKDGGIAYFAGIASHGALLRKMDIVEPHWFRIIEKESNELFESNTAGGDCLGELVVRDVVSYAAITSHPVMQGVRSLYVCGYRATFVQVTESVDVSKTLTKNIYYEQFYSRQEVKITGFRARNVTNEFFPIIRFGWVENTNLGRFVPVIAPDPTFRDSDVAREIIGSGVLKIAPSSREKDLVTVLGFWQYGRGLVVFDGTGMMVGYRRFRGNEYDWPKFIQNLLNYRRN